DAAVGVGGDPLDTPAKPRHNLVGDVPGAAALARVAGDERLPRARAFLAPQDAARAAVGADLRARLADGPAIHAAVGERAREARLGLDVQTAVGVDHPHAARDNERGRVGHHADSQQAVVVVRIKLVDAAHSLARVGVDDEVEVVLVDDLLD